MIAHEFTMPSRASPFLLSARFSAAKNQQGLLFMVLPFRFLVSRMCNRLLVHAEMTSRIPTHNNQRKKEKIWPTPTNGKTNKRENLSDGLPLPVISLGCPLFSGSMSLYAHNLTNGNENNTEERRRNYASNTDTKNNIPMHFITGIINMIATTVRGK